MCLVPISQDLVPTSQDLKHNIKIIRDQINNKIAQKIAQKITEPGVVTEGGWQYGGEPFLQSVETLRTQIQKELKNVKVLGCRVRHFPNGTTDFFSNAEEAFRWLIILIKGNVDVTSPGPKVKGDVDVTSPGPKVKLPLDTYCYIKDGKLFSGTDCDMVVVALGGDTNP